MRSRSLAATVGFIVVGTWVLGPAKLLAQAAPAAPTSVVIPASAPTPARTQGDLLTLPNVARVASPGLSLSFDATTDEKRGSVALAFASPDDSLTFSLSATGPLDQSTREAQPLGLTGLSSGAVAEFGLNWFYWPGTVSPIAVRNFCLARTKKAECDDSTLTGQDKEDYLALTYADRDPWIISASASVGRTSFTYVTRSDLAAGLEQHNDAGFGGSVGQYSPLRGYIALGYEYQRAWQSAGGQRQICTPLATAVAGSEECRSVIVGPPRLFHTHLAQLQWRKFFKAGRLAINPSVARDFESGTTAVAAPVYFFTNASGGLAGGARVGWRSDTEALTFTVFVGTALSITD